MTGKVPSNFEIGQIRVRYAAGESLYAIAKRYGISKYFVKQVLFSGRPEYDVKRMSRSSM